MLDIYKEGEVKMTFIKRAWYYVTRKKVKTILMFFILFGIATATISGLAIKKATINAREEINEVINAGFSLAMNLENNFGTGDRGLGNVPADAVDKIRNLDGIKDYNARAIGEAELINLKKVLLENPGLQYDQLPEEYENFSDLEGMTDSSLDTKFTSEVMTLTKGRHIKENDRKKVILHEEFAEINELNLNDKIKVKKSDLTKDLGVSEQKEEVELEIVGLFSGSNKSEATTEFELIENTLITDLHTINVLNKVSEGEALYQDAHFFVKDPKELPNILKFAENLPIDWKNFALIKSANNYPGLTMSLDSMDSLVNKMLAGVVIMGSLILSLVLAFWVNGRIHETGILLSLGISKFNIVMQYVAELLMIAILGFGLSYFSGQMIAQNIGDNMLEQAGKESETEFNQTLGGMQLGADPESSVGTKSIDNIDVSITLSEMGYVWLLGGIIILISVSVSSVFIIRLKPKEILSKMS